MQKQGRAEEAEAVVQSTLDACQAVLRQKQTRESFLFLHTASLAFLTSGQVKAAETLARDHLAARKQASGSVDKELAFACFDLGWALCEQGKLPEAEASLREALSIFRTLGMLNEPEVGRPICLLNQLLIDQGKTDPELARLARADFVGRVVRYRPSVGYKLRIKTPGQYRLYVRWDGHDPQSDSVIAHIAELRDGPGGTQPDVVVFQAGGGEDADFATQPWQEKANIESQTGRARPVVWNIANPGDYTLILRQLEDGAAVDAFVLQLTNLPPPQGDGPPESEIAGDKALLERDGIVVGEAENFSDRVDAPPRRWLIIPQELPGDVPHLHYRGKSYIQALPDRTPEHPALLLANRASARTQAGDYAGAEALLRENLAQLQSASTNPQPDVAITLENLGVVLQTQNKNTEAETTLRQAIGSFRELAKEYPRNPIIPCVWGTASGSCPTRCWHSDGRKRQSRPSGRIKRLWTCGYQLPHGGVSPAGDGYTALQTAGMLEVKAGRRG